MLILTLDRYLNHIVTPYILPYFLFLGCNLIPTGLELAFYDPLQQLYVAQYPHSRN